MKPELRVALLGQGFMGKAHSNAYAQAGHFYDLPYRLRRTLLCGRDPPRSPRWRIAGAGRRRPPTGAPPSPAPTSTSSTSPCRTICTRRRRSPPPKPARSCFCEKPLALSAEEGRAMVAAARGRRTLVWFNYRRVPAIAFARQLIARGPARADFPLQRRLPAAVGSRTRPAPPPGGWIRHRPDRASPTICSRTFSIPRCI